MSSWFSATGPISTNFQCEQPQRAFYAVGNALEATKKMRSFGRNVLTIFGRLVTLLLLVHLACHSAAYTADTLIPLRRRFCSFRAIYPSFQLLCRPFSPGDVLAPI